MNDKEQTHMLVKYIMPVSLVLLPILAFVILYVSAQTQNTELTWAEALLVPSSIFLMVASTCGFFLAIWWFRQSIKVNNHGKKKQKTFN